MSIKSKTIDEMLSEDMSRFYADPLAFVLYAYPWETDPSIQLVHLPDKYKKRFPGCTYGPDEWACEFLDEVGRQVKDREFDGAHAVSPIRFSTTSGHGIGKTAMTAWLVDWIMSTRPGAQGTITANTANQLSSKTWAQVARWTAICKTAHWFNITTGKGTMKMVHKQNPSGWKCEGQTCREENSEAFAGQHAPSSTSFYIFDEGSAIPDKIYDVSEGGLTDGEPMIFLWGNPTRNSGAFYNSFHGKRGRWTTRQIDSRDVAITNKKQIQEWIDDYGLDSDFVKVRVRGMFPSMSIKSLISVADVDRAFGKELRPEQYAFAPVIISCDPAWSGDDELVIMKRQGLKAEILNIMPKNDTDVYVAQILAQYEDRYSADVVFIDGGYGTGIYSAGKAMGRNWMIVWFSSASSNPGCVNKRAEMWVAVRDWLKEGGVIPNHQRLYDDLIGPEVVPRLDGKIQLESKEDMKKRKLPSPNCGDALALTFAYPVMGVRTEDMDGGGFYDVNHYDSDAVCVATGY